MCCGVRFQLFKPDTRARRYSVPMKWIAALSLFLITAQNPTYPEAWKFEQDARKAANEKITARNSTPDHIRAGVQDMEAVLAYTLRPDIEKLHDSQELPAFVYQRNDIYRDLIVGYARLRDVPGVLRCLRALRAGLTGKDAPTDFPGRFVFYADSVTRNSSVRVLLPNPEIEQEVQRIRLNDPDLAFNSYPYSTADSETISEADRISGLAQLWSEAKYNFANFDLVPNLDWNAEYAAFLPRVRKASHRYDYYNLLREFIGRLKDAHTNVDLPPGLYGEKEARVAVRTGLVEGRVLVLATPPQEAGIPDLSAGDEIETIDGKPAVQYGRSRWERLIAASTPQDRDLRIFTVLLLRGQDGSRVHLGVRKANGTTKTVSLRRSAKTVPAPLAPWEFKLLPDGTAYFAFNTCGNDTPVAGFEQNLDAIRKAGRLIIDVRQNGGGSSNVGYDILRHLVQSRVETSLWETPQYRASFRAWGRPQERYRGEPNFIDPDPNQFTGPVVVLTGARTFSAAEDFASACKTSHRVTLVGEPTGGSTGQPLSLLLPGGGSARICTKRDRYPDGSDFVGKGVLPDVEVRPTVQTVQQQRDLVMERAVEIVSQKQPRP